MLDDTALNFTLDQLADFQAVEHRLHTVGLRARLDDFDTGEVGCAGEVIAVYRPRDPNLYVWIIEPTRDGLVSASGDGGAVQYQAETVAAAIELVVAYENGGSAPLAA